MRILIHAAEFAEVLVPDCVLFGVLLPMFSSVIYLGQAIGLGIPTMGDEEVALSFLLAYLVSITVKLVLSWLVPLPTASTSFHADGSTCSKKGSVR
jgi:hypothetical protein